MAKKQDATVTSSPGEGWNMITNARTIRPNPSPAMGCSPHGLAAAGNIPAGTYSPGAVLGTGMNTDRYTPSAELA